MYTCICIYMCDATGTSLAHTRASLEYILEEKRDASSFARRECAFLGLLYLGVRIFSLCMIFFFFKESERRKRVRLGDVPGEIRESEWYGEADMSRNW